MKTFGLLLVMTLLGGCGDDVSEAFSKCQAKCQAIDSCVAQFEHENGICSCYKCDE